MYLNKLLEKKSNSNVSEATLQLIKKLNIPVTATTAIEQVESHPDFPSLYSISDSLKSWKVENAAFHIENDKIDSLPTPFIAHTRKAGGNFILVNSVNGSIDFINEKGKREQTDRESFFKEWTNTVLLAEKNDHSGEKEYKKRKQKETLSGLRIPFIITVALALVLLYAAFYSATTVGFVASILLFAKLSGCIVTGLLLWFEVDKSNPMLQQICNGGKNTNCTAVLNSKSSKLFNWLSWSEVGFFYFAGSFLYLLQTANWQLQTFGILSWLNLIALPYTLFSIFYQWRIAKQWCPLCLTVQGLLITEFVISYFGYWTAPGVTLSLSKSIPSANLLIIFTSFLLPILFWIATKKVHLAAQAAKGYKKEAAQLKYNKEIFTALLKKQKGITSSTEGLGIILGNPDAKNTLIKVCDPYCGPCAKAHKVIDELLEGNENVKVQIIFTATTHEQDFRSEVVKHLLAVASKNDEQFTTKALDEWYLADKKDYKSFAAKYPLNGEIEKQTAAIAKMEKWCNDNNVRVTPTIFINGYQFPDAYGIGDLQYFLLE